MPSASITTTISSTPVVGASREDAVVGSVVSVASTHTHTTYAWTLAYRPPGSAAAFSGSVTAHSPGTFTVDVEGSYLVRLTADLGLSTETTQYVRVRYPTVLGSLRLPAAGEGYGGSIPVPVDQGATGWTDALNTNLMTLLGLVGRVSASGNVLTVDPTAGYGDYQSIQEAVDAAVTAGASASIPYVVQVRPGTYVEDVTFKPFVYVTGWPGSDPDIAGFPLVQVRGTHEVALPGPSDNTVISYLTLSCTTATTAAAVEKTGSGTVVFRQCVLEQAGSDPAQGPAFKLSAGEGDLVECSVVANSSLGASHAAITQPTASTLYLLRCWVTGPSGMVLNETLSSAVYAEILDTTVIGQHASGTGIVTDASATEIRDCYVTSSSGDSLSVHPGAGALASDLAVTVSSSILPGRIIFDTTGVTGGTGLSLGSSEYTQLVYPGGAPSVVQATTKATSLYYDNSSSGLSSDNVQDAIDEVHDEAVLVRTLDDAYDGGVPNSGSGRTIVADQGPVRISDAPVSSDPPEAGSTNGRLEVVGGVRVGAVGAPEIDVDPNPYGMGPSVLMGNRVVPNNNPWNAGTATVMARSTGTPLYRNYNLRVQTQSSSGGGSIGRLVLQGGDGLDAGGTGPEAGSVYVQAGSSLDAAAAQAGGSVFLVPGASAGGAPGVVAFADPTTLFPATLTASGACADPIGVDGSITFATNMGAVTASVAATDTRADVVAALDALEGISASESLGVITLTTDHLGLNAEIYFLTATTGVDAAIGGFDGVPQVNGGVGSYAMVSVTGTNELSVGVGGATGPLVYNADTGKLTVPGIIDPTAVVFDLAGAPGTGASEGAIFVSDGSGGLVSGALYFQPPSSAAPTAVATGSLLVFPTAASPSQTAEGSAVWDTDDDVLTVGTGTGRVVLVNEDSTQTLTNKTILTSDNVVGLDRVPGSTYYTLQDFADLFLSAGLVSGGEVTDAGGGTVNVAGGTGFIRSADSGTSDVLFFDWAAVTGLVVPANSVRWVGVEYNAGSPQAYLNAADSWDYRTNFPIAVVFNESGTLYVHAFQHDAGDAVSKINSRFDATSHIARDAYRGGLVLDESADGSRHVLLSGGRLWYRLNTYDVADVDTSAAGTFDRYYDNGLGGWAKQPARTTWDNASYDDGSGVLASIPAGQYAVQWFYVALDGSLLCLYGRGVYASAEAAEDEGTPATAPDRVAYGSLLVGRVVFQQGAGVASAVQSTFTTSFASSLVINHGSLAGLGMDDHVQYALLSGNAARNQVTGTFDFTSGGLVAPVSNAPAQTTEGSVVWDSDDDLLTVGTGAGRKTMADTDSTQTLSGKTLTTPTIASFVNANHDHQGAAGGGKLDHGLALTGLSDDDHPAYALLAGNAVRNVVSGTFDFGTGGVLLPLAAVPAQTTNGSVVWDSNDFLLTVGTGTGRKTMVDTDSTQTLSGKTLTTPTIASFANATHNHQDAAGGGTLDHGLALTGLSDDDHPAYALLAGSAARNVVSGTFDFGTGILLVPQALVPAETAEGSVVWDSNDDLLTVGTGTGRKTMADTDSTQTLSGKTLTTPTIASFVNANHNHQDAAGGGTLDHGLALTGLSDDDHPQYALLSGNAARNPVSGTFDFGTGTLLLPAATSPAQTAEGSVVWDSDDDLLTVGTGAGRKTMADTTSSQKLTNKNLVSPIFSLDDANNAVVQDVATIVHTTTGAAASGIGTGFLFQTENGAGAQADAARVAGVLTNVVAGVETSALYFYTRTGGGSLTLRWSIDGSGNLAPSVDNSLAVGSSAARVQNFSGVEFRAYMAASDANPIYVMDNFGFHGGAGGAGVLDAQMTRISSGSTLWNMNVGLRVNGNVTRNEGTITFGTTRSSAGAGDNVTVQPSAAVASAGSSFAGGQLSLLGSSAAATGPGAFAAQGGTVVVQAGNSAAVNAAQANGPDVTVVGGNAASGAGGGSAKGGGVTLQGAAGQANGNGGDINFQPGQLNGTGKDGQVVFSINGASRTPSLVPRATNEGSVGISAQRWATVAFRDENSSGQKVVGLVSKVFADSPYTVSSTDYVILYDPTGGGSTVNLPAAASNSGRVLVVKHSSTSGNTVTLDGNGAETIDGNLTIALSALTSVTLICNGTGWFLI
jgi:hypothetical protein